MNPAVESDSKRRQVQTIVKEELNLIELPSPHAKREDFVEWDSLAFMSIVSRVEVEFQIEASPSNIQSFESIDGILEELRKAGK